MESCRLTDETEQKLVTILTKIWFKMFSHAHTERMEHFHRGDGDKP